MINRTAKLEDYRIKTFWDIARAVSYMSRIWETEKIAFKVKIVKISNIFRDKNNKIRIQDEIIVSNQRYHWVLSSKTNWNLKNRQNTRFFTNIYLFLVNFTPIFSITKYYGIAIHHLLWKFITQLSIKIFWCGQMLWQAEGLWI